MRDAGFIVVFFGVTVWTYAIVFHSLTRPTRIFLGWLVDGILAIGYALLSISDFLRGDLYGGIIYGIFAIFFFWHFIRPFKDKTKKALKAVGYKARLIRAKLVDKMKKLPKPIPRLRPIPIPV